MKIVIGIVRETWWFLIWHACRLLAIAARVLLDLGNPKEPLTAADLKRGAHILSFVGGVITVSPFATLFVSAFAGPSETNIPGNFYWLLGIETRPEWWIKAMCVFNFTALLAGPIFLGFAVTFSAITVLYEENIECSPRLSLRYGGYTSEIISAFVLTVLVAAYLSAEPHLYLLTAFSICLLTVSVIGGIEAQPSSNTQVWEKKPAR